jgi:PAS domain S-box-containing protein
MLVSALSTAVWWTRYRHRGFGRWTIAALAFLLSFLLASLRSRAPEWVTVVFANNAVVASAILYLEGAREFRGLSPGRWFDYLGGLATIGALAFFVYVAPNPNVRTVMASAYMAIMSMRTAIVLLRGTRSSYTVASRIAGGLFVLYSVTLVARIGYLTVVSRLNDFFTMTMANRSLLIGSIAEWSLLPIGFFVLADERGISELRNAKGREKAASVEVAQRREVEAVLRESERWFRQLADAAPVMIWVSGLDKGVTYVNQPWLKFTGRSCEAELGTGWADGVHVDDLTQCLDTYNHAFDERESFQMEYRLRRYDGTYRWILDHGVPVTDLNGNFAGFVGSAIDITNQREANEALSSLSRRLLDVQETERASIARELHDDLAQRAVGLAIQLHNLVEVLPDETPERSGLQQTSKHAIDLSRDIQRMAYRLHSAKLQHLGLASATQRLCEELSRQHKVRIDFIQENVPQMSGDVALCMFRVVQEALTNAIKHAGVLNVSVALHCTQTDIELLVIDGGVGFDRESAGKPGLGIISMRERLNLVGGQIHIESRPGVGTTVRARVPLTSHDQRQGSIEIDSKTGHRPHL